MWETILVVIGFVAGAAIKFLAERKKLKKDPLWKDVLEAVTLAIETAPPEVAAPVKTQVAKVAKQFGVEDKLNAFIKVFVDWKGA